MSRSKGVRRYVYIYIYMYVYIFFSSFRRRPRICHRSSGNTTAIRPRSAECAAAIARRGIESSRRRRETIRFYNNAQLSGYRRRRDRCARHYRIRCSLTLSPFLLCYLTRVYCEANAYRFVGHPHVTYVQCS